MMGWMAPLRHLGAKVLVGREPPRFADSITASSRFGLHQKAGHMTASDLCAARQIIYCQAGGPHMKRREFITLLVARPRRGRSRRARSGLGEATDRKEAHSTHRTFSAPSISSARATASNNRPLAS